MAAALAAFSAPNVVLAAVTVADNTHTRQGGNDPVGHRWEDTRRDSRVPKNGARGCARGGRGRGAGAANKNTWFSGQAYQEWYEGPREASEAVNYDSTRVGSRASGLPRFLGGLLAVESHQVDRLMDSRTTQFEAADVEKGVYVGANLDARNVHSLIARLDRTQPEGTRYDMQLKVVSENGPSTTRYDMEANSARASADEAMDQEHRRDAAGVSSYYDEGGQRWVRRLSDYRGA